jgi:hypothetical protein
VETGPRPAHPQRKRQRQQTWTTRIGCRSVRLRTVRLALSVQCCLCCPLCVDLRDGKQPGLLPFRPLLPCSHAHPLLRWFHAIDRACTWSAAPCSALRCAALLGLPQSKAQNCLLRQKDEMPPPQALASQATGARAVRRSSSSGSRGESTHSAQKHTLDAHGNAQRWPQAVRPNHVVGMQHCALQCASRFVGDLTVG